MPKGAPTSGRAGSGRTALAVCAALSLTLHVGAAVALGLFPKLAPSVEREGGERDPLSFEREIPYVTLGEREQAPFSLTWLALPEPENHAAVEPGEAVQPRLRDEEASPIAGERTGAVGPGEDLTEAQARALRELASRLEAVRLDALDAVAREANTLARAPATLIDLLARVRPVETEANRAPRAPEEPTESAQPATPGGGAENPAPEAQVTDREADPTSTIVAIVDDIGSDLVSEGVTLRTFKPVVPPGMPFARGSVVFEIEFDAEGRAYADVVEPSVNASWDDLYKNVIFRRWSATGPAIEALAGTEDRVRVRLQVNYSNRRR